MSKTKKVGKKSYELLYIISNKYSEDEVKPIVEKTNKIIKDNDGEIKHEEVWGKKRLAYAIKGFLFGYYQLVEFDLEGVNYAKIDKALRLSNEIIRYQLVLKELRSTKPSVREPRKETKEAEPVKEKAKEKMDKADLKNLDEKLDKILETSDLL
jgi:small subunit ribosomal protein S6